jgi:hypothetical protein
MFKLEIETDNAAFHAGGNSLPYEVDRIMSFVSARLYAGESSGTVTDSNGNTVGSFKLS